MSNLYTKLWTHAVLTTKSARPLIQAPLESRLHNFIHELLLELQCPARIINGMPDHVHLLFLQNPAKSMTDIIKKIKGRSSFWINQQKLAMQKFSWEPGYAAFAVSESQVQRVFEYISNQKEHHDREDFRHEYFHLIELHGLLALTE